MKQQQVRIDQGIRYPFLVTHERGRLKRECEFYRREELRRRKSVPTVVGPWRQSATDVDAVGCRRAE
jgi:hypothetical protein